MLLKTKQKEEYNMGVIHFLNVKEGDCTWIKHDSGRNTVIDVSNGNAIIKETEMAFASGNHNQKNHPVNPVEYLKGFDVKSIFRFVLTHPDMDHMDGLKVLFEEFEVCNFWDTDNNKEMDENSDWGRYNQEDWDFYQKMRKSHTDPKALKLYSGSTGSYYNEDQNGSAGGDGIYILSPTEELVKIANETGDYNDCSYVLLYKSHGKKIIFAGDSAEKTWEHILENHKEEVTNVDLLVAPHHGRKSGGNNDYLDILNPKLTLFGNAKSEDLDYASWSRRCLEYITNNQANCVILNVNGTLGIEVYVTYETFARKYNKYTFYSCQHKGWYLKTI